MIKESIFLMMLMLFPGKWLTLHSFLSTLYPKVAILLRNSFSKWNRKFGSWYLQFQQRGVNESISLEKFTFTKVTYYWNTHVTSKNIIGVYFQNKRKTANDELIVKKERRENVMIVKMNCRHFIVCWWYRNNTDII